MSAENRTEALIADKLLAVGKFLKECLPASIPWQLRTDWQEAIQLHIPDQSAGSRTVHVITIPLTMIGLCNEALNTESRARLQGMLRSYHLNPVSRSTEKGRTQQHDPRKGVEIEFEF